MCFQNSVIKKQERRPSCGGVFADKGKIEKVNGEYDIIYKEPLIDLFVRPAIAQIHLVSISIKERIKNRKRDYAKRK